MPRYVCLDMCAWSCVPVYLCLRLSTQLLLVCCQGEQQEKPVRLTIPGSFLGGIVRMMPVTPEETQAQQAENARARAEAHKWSNHQKQGSLSALSSHIRSPPLSAYNVLFVMMRSKKLKTSRFVLRLILSLRALLHCVARVGICPSKSQIK